ncbi:hypothetical protein Nepgr_001921 [Nepenthes gracilis]|uniref:Bulb-type lectin domain-containing protein n=1 Tax=Nepenthes gracilis TaxID=150966 RepID=A0AAD3P9B3_NEPGR|nr:hypothetical protein Nepgr_001921 [Nepenthes gracilis]
MVGMDPEGGGDGSASLSHGFSSFCSPLLLVFPPLHTNRVPLTAIGQNDGNVEVGASLSATTTTNSSWLSPSGDFAFGFRNLYDNRHFFLLSIWYAEIPDTIVWYAGNDGVLAPEGSKLVLTPNSGLVINDPQGNALWSSAISAGIVSHGFLNDTGNFVIKDDQNGVLWQSFDHPGDTLLPTQIMETDGVVSSRVSEANFTRGSYYCGDVTSIQPDSDVVELTDVQSALKVDFRVA